MKKDSDDSDIIEEDDEDIDVDDDNDEDNDDDDEVLSIDEVKEKKKNYTIIPKNEVKQYMDTQLQKLESITGMPYEKVYLLWTAIKDATDFENKYFGNMNKYLKMAGICQDDKKQNLDAKKKASCKICFGDVKQTETYALGCGHQFYCKECWNDYLHYLVNSTSAHEMLNAKCMSVGCGIRLTSKDWKSVLNNKKDIERYEFFYLKNFIEITKNLSFCPSPNCGNVLRYSGHSKTEILECSCGARFCVGCSNEAHNPITCKQFEKWNAKLMDEGASLKLLHTIAKCCFHCGMPTERNQGCNHMTCRREAGGCGGEWCYVCCGDWKTHGSNTGGYFSCNVYKGSTGEKNDLKAQDFKNELQKFQHFSDRYDGHEQLKKDAIKRKEKILELMPVYREKTGKEPDIYLEAINHLIECRHILKYTYAYSYFMEEQMDSTPTKTASKKVSNTPNKKSDSKNKIELFNFQQANAEGITEVLGGLIFSDLPVLIQKREDLRRYIDVSKTFFKNLIEFFESFSIVVLVQT